MRCRLLVTILIVLLILVGCTATITNTQATKFVVDCYHQLSPAEGKVSTLATLTHDGNVLVLAKHEIDEETKTLDLFVVSSSGVISLATSPLVKPGYLNRVTMGKDIVLFAQLPLVESEEEIADPPPEIDAKESDEEQSLGDLETPDNLLQEDQEEEPVAVPLPSQATLGKAVITLSSWKIIEEPLPLEEGFILVLNQSPPVESVNLFDAEDHLIAQYKELSKGKAQDVELIKVLELPMPVELDVEEISHMHLSLSTKASEGDVVSLEAEAMEALAAAFNTCYPRLRRGSRVGEAGLEVAIVLSQDRLVRLSQINDDLFSVVYQVGEKTNTYEVVSAELSALFASYKQLL
ncbi:MAG: hypothetical protein NUK65_09225 [Firmicutes bacterium]|nr:hypothetical protein [Bacillota bacterium]